ncbi:MAG: hypothetical protein NTU91_09380 [Chloroflexi bacterium]|nr:hypothetical protein [Chloroflexota bacterium]
MTKRSASKDTVEFPVAVWESAETKEELEDWLLAQDPKAVRQLRRIRRTEDLAGRGKTLSDVARRWNTKL